MANPLDRKKFTFQFPLEVDSGGGIKRDTTSTSELRLLSTVSVKQALGSERYGFPPFAFEQSGLNMDTDKSVILVATQRAITEFATDVVVLSLNLFRNVARKQVFLDIVWVDRKRFEEPSRLLINLDLGIPPGVI